LANIRSQIKRNRQNEKHRLRNRNYRGSARTAVKDARAALVGGEETQASVMAAISALDRAAQKGAIHHRNAARRKGRLMKQLAALGPQPRAAVAEPALAPATHKKEAEKKPGRVEQETKSVKETAVKKESTAKKPVVKKTAEKKPAAKKTAAKK
jgi:small subunit ribosomal protein S20